MKRFNDQDELSKGVKLRLSLKYLLSFKHEDFVEK